jgi:hypothetical protein
MSERDKSESSMGFNNETTDDIDKQDSNIGWAKIIGDYDNQPETSIHYEKLQYTPTCSTCDFSFSHHTM